jgi:hypothetical protein
MKTVERSRARELRREEGCSIKEIARRLGVAQSSVSVWVRDIELTPDQHDALRARNGMHDRQLAARRAHIVQARSRREACQRGGRDLARLGDPLHLAGSMLYWAEGSKRRNHVRLSNSDPEMLRFFARFLRECYGVPDDRMRVWCNLFADHAERQREVEDFWLDVVELPRTCLTRSTVNRYSSWSKRKRLNVLPYGTCRLSVSSTALVQSIFGAIQEYGGFERPEWLG